MPTRTRRLIVPAATIGLLVVGRIFSLYRPPHGGGKIVVVDSVLRSMDEESAGVLMVTSPDNGGVRTFTRVTLETAGQRPRLLLANTCDIQQITGAPELCRPTR
jgi:hypothetical protein